MRFRGRLRRVATGLLLAVAVAAAAEAQQPQVPVTVPTAGGDVTIIADQLEQAAPELFIATGNVELTKGGTRLMADRNELNRATGDAVPHGRVSLYAGEGQAGFLFPKCGESSRVGYYTELPFFWAIDDSQDLLVSPLVYTQVGEGFNLEYRYLLPEAQRGRAGGFFIQETAKHDASRFV